MTKLNLSVEKLSLGFLLFTGLSTFFWFGLTLLGMDLDLLSLAIALVLAVAVSRHLLRTDLQEPTTSSVKYSGFEKYLLVVIGTVSLLAIIVALYNPVVSWDSLTLYDYRGMYIAKNHSLAGLFNTTYYLSYPLMTSLIHAGVYLLGGNHPQVFYAFTYLALLGIIYSRMHATTTRTLALIATTLVATNPYLWEHATISYTNLPYTAFLLAGMLYAPRSLLLSGVLLGLSTWVRISEPFWLVALALLVYHGVSQHKYLRLGLSLTLAFTLRYTWARYLSWAYSQIDFVVAPTSTIISLDTLRTLIGNTRSILTYLSQFILMPYLGYWVLGLLSFAGLIFVYYHKLRDRYFAPLAVVFILISLMVVAGVAFFSVTYASWYSIGGSATRMMLFIVPLLTCLGVYLLHLLAKHYDKQK